MFLELKNISKLFSDNDGIDNINLEINEGELITLLGPSGCGKTTTLNTIGGFINPDNGSIILDNIDITNQPPEKRPIATVFQSYALFPHMNVIENVSYGLKYTSNSRKKQRFLHRKSHKSLIRKTTSKLPFDEYRFYWKQQKNKNIGIGVKHTNGIQSCKIWRPRREKNIL